jgi:hypothetical protein
LGSGLIELLAGVGGFGPELGLFHALLEFVDVGEHLALFFLEPFETAEEFIAFSGVRASWRASSSSCNC